MAKDIIKNIMSKFSDDKGLFQGGEEGRMFGRARDAMEGKKNTIGHDIAMNLSGVSKEGDDSWQRSLDYKDLPEITKREGGIRGQFRDLLGLDNKLGDYDALTKELRGAGSSRSHNQAIDAHDRRRAELGSDFNQKRLQVALDSGDVDTRNEMMLDWMEGANIQNWASGDGDLPNSVKDKFKSNADIADYKRHKANDPLRWANPETMVASDKGFQSGRMGWDHLGLTDFGFNVDSFKEGNLDELKPLYNSLDNRGKGILRDHIKTTGNRLNLLEGDESSEDYMRRIMRFGVDYTGEEAGVGRADYASDQLGMILNNETFDEGGMGRPGDMREFNVSDLVYQTDKAGYTKEGKKAYEERLRSNIEDAGY
tara:strand:- start:2957 stop:4060 length:1104 start_codon:yes stop_codon:yes gene_type:complete